MKLAVYCDTEAPKTLTLSGATTKYDKSKDRMVMDKEFKSVDFPAKKVCFIDKTNAEAWGFPSADEAAKFFFELTPLDGLMYSVVLEDAEWVKKPAYLLSRAEKLAEVQKRTRRTPNNRLTEADLQGSLEALREIAHQVPPKDWEKSVPTVEDLRKARKQKE